MEHHQVGIKDLEAKSVYLMLKVVGNDVWNEDERLSGSRLLEMLGLDTPSVNAQTCLHRPVSNTQTCLIEN